MKIENRFGVPETIIRAMIAQNAKYNAGNVDCSVTQLIAPPQIGILRRKHINEIVRDVTEEFWALLGSGVHHLLELGAADYMVVEERLFMTIDGWRLSGALDCQEIEGNQIDIVDYKCTAVYSVTGDEPKEEWVNQLNLQAMLVEANKPDMQVRSLNICAILRDWSGAKAKIDPFYPQAPIMMVPLPLWSRQRQLAYARDRIALHRAARFAEEMGNPLPECTREERWMKDDKWAVMKEGGSRALKVFASEAEAIALAEEKGASYFVDYRPGTSVRCGYCGVSQWCEQFASMQNKDTADE